MKIGIPRERWPSEKRVAASPETVKKLAAMGIEILVEKEAECAETAGGYAKEMSDEYKKKQSDLIHETARKSDIIITTALIPGKTAPVLVTEEMVRDMKPGSVIFDLAAPAGGNCPLCVMDQVVVVHGVTIVSYENVPSRVPMDASSLYARNVFNFLVPMIDRETGTLRIDREDEIIRGTLLTHEGRIVVAFLSDDLAIRTGSPFEEMNAGAHGIHPGRHILPG